jgi:hypothetical protein
VLEEGYDKFMFVVDGVSSAEVRYWYDYDFKAWYFSSKQLHKEIWLPRYLSENEAVECCIAILSLWKETGDLKHSSSSSSAEGPGEESFIMPGVILGPVMNREGYKNGNFCDRS